LTSEYLLTFDLSEFTRQTSQIENSYSQVGEAVRNMTAAVGSDIDAVSQKISDLTSSLSVMTAQIELSQVSIKSHFRETAEILTSIANSSKTVIDNIKGLSAAELGPLTKVMQDPKPQSAKDRLADVFPDYALKISGDITERRVEMIVDKLLDQHSELKDLDKFRKDLRKEIKHFGGKVEEEIGVVKGLIKKELTGAKKAFGGIMSRGSMGLIGGGIAGGLIAAMVMGVAEKDRLNREYGEMLNAFEATGENFARGQNRKAVQWFASFAEKAQHFLGISRQEVQGLVSDMAKAGYSRKDISERFDAGLGEVGKNVVTATLSLDKFLNLSTGTAMKSAITIAESEGVSIGKATQSFIDLAKAAQTSGVGIDKFINAVMGGYQALRQYGVEVKDVEQAMVRLVRHYKDMGMGEKAAGEYATRGMGALAQSMAGLSEGAYFVLGEKMYPGMEPRAAAQKVQEGWQQMIEENDTNMFNQMLMTMRRYVDETNPGASRAEKIAIFKAQFLPSNLAATTAYDLTDDIMSGKATEKDSADFLRGLKNSMKTEAEKLSDLYKTQRSLINGMRKIGEGVLMILTGLLGTIVVGFKSIPALVDALTSTGKEREQKLNNIQKMVNMQTNTLGAGATRLLDGLKESGGTMGAAAAQMSSNLEAAFGWNPLKGGNVKDTIKEEVNRAMGEALGGLSQGDIDAAKSGMGGVGMIERLSGSRRTMPFMSPEETQDYFGEDAREEREDITQGTYGTEGSLPTKIEVSSFVRPEDLMPTVNQALLISTGK